MNLNDDIGENETIFDEHPEGDILMDIIIDDKASIDLNKLRNYLMITPGSTYSKDAANIATEKFTELFGGHGFSFFSEILDPASEQSDMINKNVAIAIWEAAVMLFIPIHTLKIPKVKVSSEKYSTVPKSDTTSMQTSAEPATIAGLAIGRLTFQNLLLP